MAVDNEYAGRSLAHLRRKAIRPALPARLFMVAAPNAGKTYTSLQVAEHLTRHGGEIVLIDTEKQQGGHTASVTYADRFDFDHVPWELGWFDPRDLNATLVDLADTLTEQDVCILDGIAPFWTGRGGVLDLASKFGDWKDVRPLLQELVETIKTFPAHVIVTVRAKVEYAISEAEDERGRTKQKIEVLGVGPQFDTNFLYEMQVGVHLDQRTHELSTIKSRSSVLADRSWAVSEIPDFAEQYAGWLAAGQAVVPRRDRVALVESIDRIPDAGLRKTVKHEFVSEFGHPDSLLQQDYDRARSWVDRQVEQHTPADTSSDDTEPSVADQIAGMDEDALRAYAELNDVPGVDGRSTEATLRAKILAHLDPEAEQPALDDDTEPAPEQEAA
ncbi:MAG: AAA family ATPase [Actinomycetota bacterium]